MADATTPNLFDDSLDPDAPFDPAQWAMHGLLSTYFEAEAKVECWRAEAALRRITTERPVAFLVLRKRRARWAVAAAAAAIVIFGLFASRPTSITGTALAQQLKEVGYQPPVPNMGPLVDLTDRVAVSQAEDAIAAARARRDRMLEAGDSGEAMFAWAKVYRNLRSLGRWDDALQEMHAALAFSQEIHERKLAAGTGAFAYLFVCLTDLGDTYAALGDYERAIKYHSHSLELALQYEDWLHTAGPAGDKGLRARMHSLASTAAPRYWRLSALAAVQGDLETAWDHHNEAGDLLVDFCRSECDARGLARATEGPLYDLCFSLFALGDTLLDSMIVKIRDHLVREARLHRLGRKLDVAEEFLRLAATIPYVAWRDESRLDFVEPIEHLRIAIARGDFEAALAAADEAEQHTGPVPLRDSEGRDVSQPPIGPLARAELMFLRGVALTALSPDDPDALNLMESAVTTVDECAASLPEERRALLLRRFDDWNHVAREVRRNRTKRQR